MMSGKKAIIYTTESPVEAAKHLIEKELNPQVLLSYRHLFALLAP